MSLAAGRIGPGSDAQGWDDARSRDHHWGVRLTLVLDDWADRDAVEAVLARQPGEFLGVPTRFRLSPTDGVDIADPDGDRHGHEVTTLDRWLSQRLGAARPPLDDLDWLAVPEQSLLELTGGEVWRDDAGALTVARRALAAFPDGVWRARLAAGWWHLSIEASYVGRCAELGDELGWRILAARQADRLAQLTFLLARRYRPYRKWQGTVLATLPAPGPAVRPHLAAAVSAATVDQAVDALGAGALALWEHQRTLFDGLPDVGPPPYRPELWRHDLPAMAAATQDLVPQVLRERLRWPIGGVDQWLDWPANSGDTVDAARDYVRSRNR